jgi:hypothetical protein
MKKLRQKKLISKLNEAFDPLKSTGLDIILPENIHVDHPLRYLIFAFSVKDPRHIERELKIIFESLLDLKDIADFFYLVPLYGKALFCSGGYKINSNRITELLSQFKEDNVKDWEYITLQPIPNNLIDYLPALEFRNSPVYQIQIKMFELLGLIQVLKKTKDYIEPLSLDQNKYVLESYKRQKNRLIQEEKNLDILAEETKDYFLTEFSSQSKEPCFEILYNALSLIEISLKDNKLDELLGKLDVIEICNAIDLLE